MFTYCVPNVYDAMLENKNTYDGKTEIGTFILEKETLRDEIE